MTLEQLLSAMHEVSIELDSIDESDPRHEGLIEKQAAIRKQLREFDYDRSRPPNEVKAELQHLRTQLAAAEADRIGTIKGRFTGADLAVGGKLPATDINRRIDDSNQIDELRTRIEHLEGVLGIGADVDKEVLGDG